MHLHRSTNKVPFSVFLSQPPPSPFAGSVTGLSVQVNKAEGTKYGRVRFFERLRILMATTGLKLNSSQDSSKHYDDSILRTTSTFATVQVVVLDRPPKQAASDEVRRKLLPRSIVPFKVLSVTLETATLDEDGVSNTKSFDRVTLTPNVRIHVTNVTTLQRESPVNTHRAIDTGPPGPTIDDKTVHLTTEVSYTTEEYGIDRIVNPKDHSDVRLFRVRW